METQSGNGFIRFLVDFWEFKRTILGLTPPELFFWIVAIALVVALFWTLLRTFMIARGTDIGEKLREILHLSKHDSGGADTVHVVCASCKWEGDVYRLKKVCPVCGDSNFSD
jgi:hypothetical protein